ncbi:MAG: glycosyltransferase [Chitinophagaceae bacterium]|jgi:glycosyltransferase involved in cell wall biosynthesis
MKFIINTTNLQSGGALQVALSLLEDWNIVQFENEFHVFLSPQLNILLTRDNFGTNFTFYTFKKNPTNSIFDALSFYKKLRRLEKQITPDAVFTVFGPALWQSKAPHLVGFANGFYLFDHSDYIRKKILTNLIRKIKYYIRHYFLFSQLKKEGDHYWVETDNARERLAATIDKPTNNISVIGNTYGSSFKNKAEHKGNTNNTFNLLYVSAYYEHKNFEIIPKVITILKEKNIACTFILTLPDDKYSALFGELSNSEYLKNVGPTNPQEIIGIYQNADAIFMPSMLETFSANYPEAMKMELPIICSDYDFSRNICGDAALFFDAQNPIEIAHKIIEFIENTELQKQLIEAGKRRLQLLETPESRAKKLLQLLNETAQMKNGNK